MASGSQEAPTTGRLWEFRIGRSPKTRDSNSSSTKSLKPSEDLQRHLSLQHALLQQAGLTTPSSKRATLTDMRHARGPYCLHRDPRLVAICSFAHTNHAYNHNSYRQLTLDLQHILLFSLILSESAHLLSNISESQIVRICSVRRASIVLGYYAWSPQGPCAQIVYTLGPKYPNRDHFKGKVYTIWVHGPFGGRI